MKYKIDIKPLSVNKAWQGRKFKSKDYKNYITELTMKLPDFELPEEPYELVITWGFSSVASDIDNPSKPFIDVLAAKYGFNDKRIFRLVIDKQIVKKGEDFICFELKHLVN